MTDKLRLRAYNVLFGDAFLLSIPDRDKHGHTQLRHLLIDVGNAYQDKAGGARDFVFEPIVKDIQAELGNQPLDLYISTHEHYDHVQGLRHVSTKVVPGINIPIVRSWLTASAAPDYEARFPNSKKQLARALVTELRQLVNALTLAGEEMPPHLRLLLDINDPGLTDLCVMYILAQSAKKYFIYRDLKLGRKHPFKEVKFDIWAPEQDSSLYYQAIRKLAAAAYMPAAGSQGGDLRRIPPPPGVDTSAFNNLLGIRRDAVLDTMLFIDKAANNTSIVFTLEWRGWKLLFAGDAELRSWEMMDAQNKLSPVDFIKISHHGSNNGTPPVKMLEKLFPAPAAKKRLGLLSTFQGTYNDVPDADALNRYQEFGVELVSIGEKCAPGKYIDIFFPEGAAAPEL